MQDDGLDLHLVEECGQLMSRFQRPFPRTAQLGRRRIFSVHDGELVADALLPKETNPVRVPMIRLRNPVERCRHRESKLALTCFWSERLGRMKFAQTLAQAEGEDVFPRELRCGRVQLVRINQFHVLADHKASIPSVAEREHVRRSKRVREADGLKAECFASEDFIFAEV